jgi:ketol-acid reductoisomerase
VHQDFTKRAKERCLATAFAIGSGHVFETTFENEVYSDLTGERCVLMGLIEGAFRAQYNVLRSHGHSPSEAFNETVEEALQSLYPLINQRGMDWMYANCSTTAQRGALDWAPRFEAVLKPVIEECYQSVRAGKESQKAIDANSRPDYREQLNKELAAIDQSEMWTAGRVLRPLRPK